MRREGRNLLLYGASHWASDRLADPEKFLREDIKDSELSLDFLRGRRVVLDFLYEGQDPSLIKPLIDCLSALEITGLAAVFNACTDVTRLEYPAISLPGWCSDQGMFLTRLAAVEYTPWIDKKFLCLMRIPTVSRFRIAQFLHGVASARFSFGSACGPHGPELQEFRELPPMMRLPRYIDGIVPKGITEHDQTDQVFRSCFFNLVVETSSQHDRERWRSVFITEKTFKSFALRQVPIWFAVPGLVREVKNLGFDLFEDIVDHGYDDIQDEDKRFNRVFELIRTLDQHSLQSYQNLRKQIDTRLQYNYERLREISKSQSRLLRDFLEAIDE